jgi:hypothetical protein
MGEGGGKVKEKNYKRGKDMFREQTAKRIEPPGTGGYGLSTFVLVDWDKIKERTIGVIYKETAKDRGLALNYRPFCGEKADWFREEKGYGKSN